MATEVAVLTARLEADVRKFERGMRKADKSLGRLEGETRKTEKSQGRLDKQIGNTGLTMKTVFAGAAGAATIKFMKDTVREASSLNESINAVTVTFGESAEDILALGENAAQSVGLANSEFNQLAVGFSAFVESIDQGQGDVAGIMDDLTTRIADFASVMDLDVPEAAEKFRSGLAGETEPLRKFGIDVSAAAVNLKAMELGLADSTAELSEQDKTLARYKLIMEQTEKTAGDFANTQDDFANASRTAKAEFKDFEATIGAFVLPTLGEFISVGSDLITVFDGIADALPGGAGEGFKFIAFAEQAFPPVRILTDGLEFLSGMFEDTSQETKNFNVELEQFHRSLIITGEGAEQTTGDIEALNEATDADRILRQYADRLEDIGDNAGNSAPNLQDMAEAQLAVNNAALAAASPIFGAISAINRLEEAAEEANPDFFEMAELTLEAQSALSELGAGNVEAGVKAIADAMDAPISQVRTLLEEMGILTEGEWTTTLLFDVSMSAADRALLNQATRTGGTSTVNVNPADRKFTNRQGGGFLNRPSLVGEAGAELFVPTQSGSVIPANSISLTQNFHRVEGDNLESDIANGLIMSGISRYIESRSGI